MQSQDRVACRIRKNSRTASAMTCKDKVDHSILAEETISVISTCILGQTGPTDKWKYVHVIASGLCSVYSTRVNIEFLTSISPE